MYQHMRLHITYETSFLENSILCNLSLCFRSKYVFTVQCICLTTYDLYWEYCAWSTVLYRLVPTSLDLFISLYLSRSELWTRLFALRSLSYQHGKVS